MATAMETAKHICLGDRRFRELLEAGVILRQASGEYDLDEVRKTYIEHLREQAAGRRGKGELELTDERAKLAREQAEAALRKNQIARGEFVAIEDVVEQVESEYSIVRERLLAIPGKIADELVGCDRPSIEAALSEEITEALNELHSPAAARSGLGNAGGEAR